MNPALRPTARWICAAVLIPLVAVPAFPQSHTFTKVKYMVPVGSKAKAVKATLRFTDTAVQAVNAKNGSMLKEIAFDDITGATYSKSKHPRWKETLALGLALGLFALPLLFAKSKKHWLTIQTNKKKDYMMLRLDKKNYQQVLLALDSSIAIDVDHVEQ